MVNPIPSPKQFVALLSIAAIAALAFAALATASATAATVLCKSPTSGHTCTTANRYGTGTSINASIRSGTKLTFQEGLAVIECGVGNIASEITSAGGSTENVVAKNSALNLGSCNGSFTTLKPGQIEFIWTAGSNNGSFVISALEMKIQIAGTTCFYGGNLHLGTAVVGGSPAFLKMTNTPVERLAGSGGLCANPARMSAEFEIKNPAPLFVTSGL